MHRPMKSDERSVVARAIAEQERALRRLHVRGARRDPVLAALLSGESQGQKVAAVQDRLSRLRTLG